METAEDFLTLSQFFQLLASSEVDVMETKSV